LQSKNQEKHQAKKMRNPGAFKSIRQMMSAHYPVLYLQTYEHRRIIDKIIDLSQKDFPFDGDKKYEVYKWNIVNGTQQYDFEDISYQEVGEEDISGEQALIDIVNLSNGGKRNQIFILEDFHEYMDSPEVKVRLRQLSEDLKLSAGYKHIFIISPVLILPTELEKYITIINIPLPDEHDLNTSLSGLIRDINNSLNTDEKIVLTDEVRNDLVSAALGMTVMEAEQAFALAFIEGNGINKSSKNIISREKQQIIKKSGFLEYFDIPGNFHESIGGLENLKAWLIKRGAAFSNAARTFGLKEPKGVLFTGVPGCGKSLTAKAVSSLWSMPLIRFDIGKVFESDLGGSEHNIRRALDIAEAVAPSILWIDEIEKGLSGMKSSGQSDGGTTARVFGTLLTWMQEKNRPVFVVATSNNIDDLPPELLRKGRFDSIFYVDLPNKKEREAIFSVHLKNALKQESLSKDFDVSLLAERTKGFNGAEIEETVKEGMFSAFTAKGATLPKLGMKHLVEAIESIKGSLLSRVMKDKISFDRARAKARFVMASEQSPEAIKEIFAEEGLKDIRTGQEIKAESRDWIIPQPKEG
jgi:ATP-dependent 26S proteasome regulatory subunit